MEEDKKKLRTISGKRLEKLVEHRGHSLRIDKVIFDSSRPNNLVGYKTIDPYDFDLVGHFPKKSVYLGNLTVECAEITAAALIKLNSPEIEGESFIVGTDKVRFKRPALPGDTLTFTVTFLKQKRGMFFFDATVTNQRGEIVTTIVNIIGAHVIPE